MPLCTFRSWGPAQSGGGGVVGATAATRPASLARGEDERALALARRGLEIARAAGDSLSHVASLFTLATVARRRGDHEGAVGAFAEALRLSVDVGDRSNAAYCLEGVAEVAAEQSRPARAARLWGAAAALLATFDPELYPHTPDRARRDAAVAAARARLGEGPFAEAWAAGERLTLEQAVALAAEMSEG